MVCKTKLCALEQSINHQSLDLYCAIPQLCSWHSINSTKRAHLQQADKAIGVYPCIVSALWYFPVLNLTKLQKSLSFPQTIGPLFQPTATNHIISYFQSLRHQCLLTALLLPYFFSHSGFLCLLLMPVLTAPPCVVSVCSVGVREIFCSVLLVWNLVGGPHESGYICFPSHHH